MKLNLESIEKFKCDDFSGLVLIADQEKLLGKLPRDLIVHQTSVQETLKKQATKVLSDPTEIINADVKPMAICQVPVKKGLNWEERLRLLAGRLVELQKSRSLKRLAISVDQISAVEFQALCEGVLISAYEFRKYKSEKKVESDWELVFLTGTSLLKSFTVVLADVETVCRQINACRDLVNEPGSFLDPRQLTEYARKAAKEFGLAIHIRDEKKLQSEGFQGLWTVGKGSDRPPRMVTLTYDGNKGNKSGGKKSALTHLCLVGKGVTFDTGGISIKPSAGMWEMKCDMAGAATVVSALCAIAALKLPIKVTGVLCLAENRPGNASVLPGDIFTAKNGKTIMVDNTDAEGRLILTDGLAEAGAVSATHIIDLATLTGAIVRALGPAIAGLFTNDEAFGQMIVKSGEATGEKFCALPMDEEYREYLDDPVADMKNVGKAEAGAITAALFLQEFVPPKTAWSHLDIAGTAFTTSTWKYFKPGGTGFGVKTLIDVARKLSV